MISDERLEELAIEEDLHNFPPTQDELNGMAKELLALRKAFSEPYGYIHQEIYESGVSCGLSADFEAYQNSSSHIPLYRKPTTD